MVIKYVLILFHFPPLYCSGRLESAAKYTSVNLTSRGFVQSAPPNCRGLTIDELNPTITVHPVSAGHGRFMDLERWTIPEASEPSSDDPLPSYSTSLKHSTALPTLPASSYLSVPSAWGCPVIVNTQQHSQLLVRQTEGQSIKWTISEVFLHILIRDQ